MVSSSKAFVWGSRGWGHGRQAVCGWLRGWWRHVAEVVDGHEAAEVVEAVGRGAVARVFVSRAGMGWFGVGELGAQAIGGAAAHGQFDATLIRRAAIDRLDADAVGVVVAPQILGLDLHRVGHLPQRQRSHALPRLGLGVADVFEGRGVHGFAFAFALILLVAVLRPVASTMGHHGAGGGLSRAVT